MARRVLGMVSLTFFLCASAGCKGKQPPPPGLVAAASASALASANAISSAAAATSSSASNSGKMAHCPSTVGGASTIVTDVPGGVQLLVTANGEPGVSEVRARAKFLSDAARTDSPTIRHTGTGEGGGVFGRCPVVMRDTTVDVQHVDSGAKITVKPKDVSQVDWLRRESRERLSDLSAPGSEGAGVGKMGHCPSAVDGATTAVKGGQGSFDVLVTAKSEVAIKQIRERAKHLAEASKQDGGGVHTGEGTGGGGVGRCPVVMKDTVVTEKDVDDGALLTVRPVKPGDLASLRKEAEDRVAKFGPVTK